MESVPVSKRQTCSLHNSSPALNKNNKSHIMYQNDAANQVSLEMIIDLEINSNLGGNNNSHKTKLVLRFSISDRQALNCNPLTSQ